MSHKHTGKQYVLKKVRLSRLNEWQRNASHTEMRLGASCSSDADTLIPEASGLHFHHVR